MTAGAGFSLSNPGHVKEALTKEFITCLFPSSQYKIIVFYFMDYTGNNISENCPLSKLQRIEFNTKLRNTVSSYSFVN